MDEQDLEARLRVYRPVDPPAALRARVVAAASRHPAERAVPALREWLPAAAALVCAILFYWMAAHERQLIVARFAGLPPIDESVAVVGEELER